MARLRPELEAHIVLCEESVNVLGVCVGAVGPVAIVDISTSLKVCCSLMNRLANDVHCASLLAARGYPAQVATIAASAFETAHCIATIGADDAAAERWVGHDDPTRPFVKARELVRRGVEAAGVAEEEAEATVDLEYRVYRQLCLVKHANPLIQSQLGIEVGEAVTVYNGPDTSDESIRVLWFGLEQSARLAALAAWRFEQAHLRTSRPDLAARIEALGRARTALAQRAIARWGQDDPCPGKW